ncbi:MAG TPA: hypothetical protein VI981_02690 [Candidatus Paceibacterota bacterium]
MAQKHDNDFLDKEKEGEEGIVDDGTEDSNPSVSPDTSDDEEEDFESRWKE